MNVSGIPSNCFLYRHREKDGCVLLVILQREEMEAHIPVRKKVIQGGEKMISYKAVKICFARLYFLGK